MIRVLASLAGSFWLLTTGIAAGQTFPGGERTTGSAEYTLPQSNPDRKDPAPLRQTYEDIAIMRRLLDQALAKVTGLSAGHSPTLIRHLGGGIGGIGGYGAIGSPGYGIIGNPNQVMTGGLANVSAWHAAHHDPHGFAPVEGYYLQGHGVVFTTNLPEQFVHAVRDPEKGPQKPLSDWERARRELRGETVEGPAKAAPRKPSLTEAVLKVLADNGHHFSQLGDDEQLTVALTLRGTGQQCMACHAVATATSGVPARRTHPAPATAAPYSSGASPTSVGRQQATGDDDQTAARRAEARRQILVGDLHLKQGQAQEAVAAFRRAVETYPGAGALLALNRDASKIEIDNEVRLLYSKLVQALLAAGRTQEALDTLQRVQRDGKAPGTTGASRPPTTTGVDVPEKLILSAPVSLLKQVGSGKISFEEFKKRATVEHLTFSEEGRKGEQKGTKEKD